MPPDEEPHRQEQREVHEGSSQHEFEERRINHKEGTPINLHRRSDRTEMKEPPAEPGAGGHFSNGGAD